LQEGLDNPNHVETSHEFGFYAHADSAPERVVGKPAAAKSNGFCQTGESTFDSWRDADIDAIGNVDARQLPERVAPFIWTSSRMRRSR